MKYAETLVKLVIVAVAMVGLAACASKPKEPDMSKVCPSDLVQAVLANQRAIEQAKRGVSTISDLEKLGLGVPQKTVMLTHKAENDVAVALFPTAVPNCPFMLPGMTYTPVLLGPGDVVLGYGMDDIEKYHAKGWVIQGADWPWQDYNYGYLPADLDSPRPAGPSLAQRVKGWF